VKVLVVSGIWPPDVGGPASHAPEIADGLTARGHSVEVITTASAPPEVRAYPIRHVSRSLPPVLRHAAVAALVARRSRVADVVYATSMVGRSSFAARAPLVVKVAGDPAYERSLRRGLYTGTLDEFQDARVGRRAELLRTWRTVTARRAACLLCPSSFLRAVVLSWGIAPERVSVLPNAAPPVPSLPPREELRRRLGVEGNVLAFAGRITRAKSLETALDALRRLGDVTLLIAGDGEERARLESVAGENVRFLGAIGRDAVLELFAASDAALLSSSWENFPHALVEALAVGAPVIATRVGGVPEIVDDGVNGLLVPRGDPEALADAIRRFFGDDALRERLRAAAAPSVERFSQEAVLDRLEDALERAASKLPFGR
jgi:glycosyltransferase involved in cell wall biosynthesis